MSDHNDGGPAFPHDNQEMGDRHRIAQPGMSLRDWFAGQALAGMLADSNVTGTYDKLASAAYDMADAMLAARRERKS